ncbi:MAG: hypothetical protein ABI771_12875 [Betaproteobacteria bacterium]
MSLCCPNCSNRLPTHVIRKVFVCPYCRSGLLANTTLPIIFAWLSWSLMDFALQSFVYSYFGYEWWPGIVTRIAASALMGFTLIWVIFSVFVKVRAAPQ